MRLVPWGQSLHLHRALFSPCQHLASTWPCPTHTEQLKFNGMEFSKSRKHSLGSATLSFSYSSFNSRFSLQGESLQGPSGKQTESGKCLICWPQKRCSFHMGERSVKKKKKNTLHFPQREGSSSGSHSNSQRLSNPAVKEPEVLAPTPGTTEMTMNFPWNKNTQKVGRKRSKQRPEKHPNTSYTRSQHHITTWLHCVPSGKCPPLSGLL